MVGRQDRLRPEYKDWYPGVTADTWHDAVWVREMVLHQQRGGGPRWEIDGRILTDEHFDFQGVSPASPTSLQRLVGNHITHE